MIRFRTIRLTSLSARERDLLNAYYIEDLKYVNRRLSIPSGLFSSPKRVPSIHEPNQHRLPLIRTREPPLSTLLTALFLSKCNRIDPEGESASVSFEISASFSHQPFLLRYVHYRSEII